MRKSACRVSVWFVLALLLLAMWTACDGVGGVNPWNPVDEDYSRPSPDLTAEGALLNECTEPSSPLPEDQVFEYAVCLCGDLQEVGHGFVTRSSSWLLGPDSGLASVGINGEMHSVGESDVDGHLNVANGLRATGQITTQGDLIAGDDSRITGTWSVGRDLWVDGDLEGVGTLMVDGDLYVSGDFRVGGTVAYRQGHQGFTYRGLPCDCSPDRLLDVPQIIAAHAEDNDNHLLPRTIASSDLVLDAGVYYFSSSDDLVDARSITVRDRVEIYVDDDIETVGSLDIQIEHGAELELWVSGIIHTVGNLSFSSEDDRRPRAFKLYMGGEGSALVSVGDAFFVGSIYAPEVDIQYVGSLEVHGALFANNLHGTGDLMVYYDTDIVAPDPCVDEHLMKRAGE
ncbi:MAG: hypothetical protein JW797_14355 [Bradymonadales bacterium]|nr:hypothetical protein [Bradymonadales bacterium]